MITLAMIVKNEAARLAECLASAAPAVDEVLVVDTGSTDGSVDLVRAHGARVIEWPWRDDFAAARNESLRHAGGDWILVLDADERLAPGAAGRLHALVDTATVDGFNCRLVSALPPGEPSPAIAHWYCRLFRKREGVAFEGRVHEQIAPSIVRAGGRIAQSDVVILHEGYAEANAAKLQRNVALLRRETEDRADDAFARFNLGLALTSIGEIDEARRTLERVTAARPNGLPRDLQAVAWMKLAELRVQDGDWRGSAAAAERALAIEPDLALARFTLGRALFEQGAFQAATLLFDDLVDAPADALGMTLHPRLIAVARAVALLRQRRCTEAVATLEPVAVEDPTGDAALHLGNAYLAVGRLAEAADAYRLARSRGVNDAGLERRLALCVRLGPRLESAVAVERACP